MNDLLANLDKLHTTELGAHRIRRNLGLGDEDAVAWCKQAVLASSENAITRKGKNWYVREDDFILTINAYSYTIITVHKAKGDVSGG